MGTIRVLDEHIANQIAAGEVVERPASVVKELLENAIDAGATRIDVTVEEGGLALIRVTDNGKGMDAEDCRMAFFRHATSKIETGKDLFRIRSLGFRGEALPSIAAVARVTLTTAAGTEGLGHRIAIEGGNVTGFEEVSADRGTDIVVKDLFYNTPARLKYMKTVQTEMSHISDYLYRLAFAYPEIAFSLRHNGNLLLQTPGRGDLLQVIAAVYGTASARQMIPIEAEDADYRLSGYIGKPEISRSNRQGITLIVNGRYVRHFGLSAAIQQAYHTLLPIHRFPLVVLRLAMDPSLVDVNVHPAKLEVRFSKDAELFRFVETELRRKLRGETLIPAPRKAVLKEQVIQETMPLYAPDPARKSEAEPGAPEAETAMESRPGVGSPEAGTAMGHRSEARASSVRSRSEEGAPEAETVMESRSEAGAPGAWPVIGSRPGADAPDTGAELKRGPGREAAQGAEAEAGRRPDRAAGREAMSGAVREGTRGGTKSPRLRGMPPSEASRGPLAERALDWLEPPPQSKEGPVFPELHPIGQLHGTYIVAQNDSGLFLIDQHAAHERINYEKFYELFGNPAAASQPLVVPFTLELTPSEAATLKERLPMFAAVGVEIEPFGGQTFLIRACPHWFPSGEEERIVREMAEWILSEKGRIDIAKLREKSSILCSCKSSVRANEPLTHQEMRALLDRLAQCRSPFTCPHGRPIVVSFSTYELEKMFKRVM